MRFFSNDARDSADDQTQEDRPERVQSDPVAVPNQRPPSPWAKTPEETDTGQAADGRQHDTVAVGPVGGTDTDERREEGTVGRPFHEPDAAPTAFGASTVGGAVAASATANPEETGTDRAAGSTYASSTVGPRDGHDSADAVDLPLDDLDSRDRAAKDDRTAQEERADRDRAAAGDLAAEEGRTTEEDRAAEEDRATEEDRAAKDEGVAREDGVATAAALKDDGGFEDPKAVDPATDKPLDAAAGPLDVGTTDDKAADDSVPDENPPPAASPAPVAAAVPVAAAAAKSGGTFFAADDARTFQERWRDVQLRFVDSPKDAAADAAKLVDEAVEKLTATLKAQRDDLTGESEDTEELRVQLRGYREILNRILAL
jgi:hypothetical protein